MSMPHAPMSYAMHWCLFRTVTRRLRWWRGLALVIVTLATWAPLQAAVLPCPAGDVACLIAAINTANGNGEADIITLAAGTYLLTTVDNTINGNNGLPSMTSPITLQGTGAETTILERDASALPFRLVHVSAEGMLQLEGLTVRGGSAASLESAPPPFAGDGGGILNLGDVRITNSNLTGNAADSGGSVFNTGTMTLTNSTVAGNFTGRNGGGLFNSGTVTLTKTTVANNSGDLATLGGGIFNDGTVILTNSTVADNLVDAGGGLFNNGLAILTNSTVAGNAAGLPDIGGGGIDNRGTMILTNSTVADNLGFSGGVGGIQTSGTVTLQNTILARNRNEFENPSVGADCAGAVTSLGHNVIGDLTGCTTTLLPTDLTGDPGVGEFTDDGTPGQGHLPLLAGSPAINAGDPEVCAEDPRLATDQLGQPRIGICDIGAIEFQALTVDTSPPTITIIARPTMLWPPNGKLVSVQVSGTITDEPGGSGVNASSAAFVVLDEYGQLQPHGSLTLGTDGRYAFTVQLQASRKGNDQDGRHYTIEVSGRDHAGNLGVVSTRVTVPHDQGKPRQH
jgi:hypothetical protein